MHARVFPLLLLYSILRVLDDSFSFWRQITLTTTLSIYQQKLQFLPQGVRALLYGWNPSSHIFATQIAHCNTAAKPKGGRGRRRGSIRSRNFPTKKYSNMYTSTQFIHLTNTLLPSIRVRLRTMMRKKGIILLLLLWLHYDGGCRGMRATPSLAAQLAALPTHWRNWNR